jgi:hypothetical protein
VIAVASANRDDLIAGDGGGGRGVLEEVEG